MADKRESFTAESFFFHLHKITAQPSELKMAIAALILIWVGFLGVCSLRKCTF